MQNFKDIIRRDLLFQILENSESFPEYNQLIDFFKSDDFNLIVEEKYKEMKEYLTHTEMNNQILNYLIEHDYISIRGLEVHLDIPITTLDKAINGNRLIPKRHVYKVYNHLFKLNSKNKI